MSRHVSKTLTSRLASYIMRSASEARRWFRAGYAFWLWATVTLAILLIFYMADGKLEDRVRWAGTLFELLGIAAIVLGIDRARRSFGKPSVLRGILIWFADIRFIFFRRPTISVSAGLAAGVGTVTAIGTIVTRAGRTAEERLADLERQTKELQANYENLGRKVDQQERQLRAELEKEAAERRISDRDISKKLEEGMIGDSNLELAGVFYLLIGLPMANTSDFVAAVLASLGLR